MLNVNIETIFVPLLDGKVLATFEQSARKFLFPGPSFAPKDDIRREILLPRTFDFSVGRVKFLSSFFLSKTLFPVAPV